LFFIIGYNAKEIKALFRVIIKVFGQRVKSEK